MKFRVILPIDIDGKVYEYGSEIELPLETATRYSHALIVVEKEREQENGGNS